MRTTIIIILLSLLRHSCFAQTLLEKEAIRDILNSTEINFSDIKGDFKNISDTDSVFAASSSLPDYRRAEILVNIEHQKPRLIIELDSTTTRKGKKMVERWKYKMSKILGKEFVTTNVNQSFGKSLGGVIGYVFRNPQIQIVIIYSYSTVQDISYVELQFERVFKN